jgi:hypothetical protein
LTRIVDESKGKSTIAKGPFSLALSPASILLMMDDDNTRDGEEEVNYCWGKRRSSDAASLLRSTLALRYKKYVNMQSRRTAWFQ